MKATSSLPVVVFLILTISQGVLSNMGGCCLSAALLSQTDICAVRGSSVVISCSFKNPCNLTISKIYWVITTQEGKTPTDLRLNAAYKGRVQYFWKNDTNCTMEIQNVKKEDSSSYQPIFEIKNANHTRKGQFEVNLTVTDLTVTPPQPVIEGHAVNLSCMSSCSEMDKHKVIWRKNGQDLPGKQKYRIQIQNVSIENEGLYSCALKGYKETATTPVKLNVMFPAKSHVLYVIAGVSVCGAAGLICVLVWIRHHRMNKRHMKIKDQGTCPSSAEAAGGVEDNVQYARVLPKHNRQTAGVEDDIQYASVQFKRNRQTAEGGEDNVQYASVQFKKAGTTQCSPDQPEGEL
ncbi:uncharacterized protein LOC125297935 isoform X2 [Alosa alosa]|uniref:uncharacterized protein LOC125297935 isoform X2 n=1 Tax=Alosa alosa TaxID=278164 RepID=UPI0020151390|nr:uncharacterized protein LOC125297935 isoform X2 [Alosa alosa]